MIAHHSEVGTDSGQNEAVHWKFFTASAPDNHVGVDLALEALGHLLQDVVVEVLRVDTQERGVRCSRRSHD
jgi:hypothetical protein